MRTPQLNSALHILRKTAPDVAELVVAEQYALWEERTGLLRALKEYGSHKLSCAWKKNIRKKCNCGLALAISTAEAKR